MSQLKMKVSGLVILVSGYIPNFGFPRISKTVTSRLRVFVRFAPANYSWHTDRRKFLPLDSIERNTTPPSAERRPTNDGVWFVSHPIKGTATLMFQPNFSSWSTPKESRKYYGARSLSAEFRPDVVLFLESNNGPALLVYGAKYRTSRAGILDAMKSAHTYQNALRFRGIRPTSSLLLVPQASATLWLAETAFQREHGIGIIELNPDTDIDLEAILPGHGVLAP